MGKLKNLFLGVSNSLKQTFKKFPITIIIVYIVTLLCTFGTDDFLEAFIDNMWFYMMAVWAIGTLFSEKFFKNNYVRAVSEIISLIIAFIFRWIIMDEIHSQNMTLMKIYITYILVIPLVTVYKMLKDSNLSVKEYAIRVLGNIGKTSAIYALANLGVFIVMLVFIELILDGNDYDILPRTLILLLGGFYVPAMLDAITNVKSETGKFMRILLTRILMPVAIFLIGTLYLYVIKIFLIGELLNKSLFFILSLTFSLTIPGVILLKNYDDNKVVLKISNILLYSFIPLMILQIIAMNVRVVDYGLTESRYMGYLLILFEIIFIALIIIKKSKHLDKIILVFAGFVIVGLLTPLNVFDVPVYSQTARITKMLKTVNSFEDLTIKEKNECKKAFVYVNRSTIPEYLDKKLSKEVIETIENYIIDYSVEDENIYYDSKYEHVSMYDSNSPLSVEGYKMLYHSYSNYNYNNKEDINIKKYEIKDKDGKIRVTVDLENLIREMYKAENENTEKITFEKVRLLKTSNENVMFYVTDFSLTYELYKNELEHVSIDGYILVK